MNDVHAQRRAQIRAFNSLPAMGCRPRRLAGSSMPGDDDDPHFDTKFQNLCNEIASETGRMQEIVERAGSSLEHCMRVHEALSDGNRSDAWKARQYEQLVDDWSNAVREAAMEDIE